jgi:hypothetical protein
LLGSEDYILLKITCYNHRKYIYFSATNLINQCTMTTPPPCCLGSPPKYLLVTQWIRRIHNSLVWGQSSTGSIFNVSGSSQNLEIKYMQSCWKNDPGYIFNDSRSQISTVKKYPRFNIQYWKMKPESIFNPVQNTSFHQRCDVNGKRL